MFIGNVVSQYPGRELHVVLGDLSTHAGPDVARWLGRHPNITLHFIPTGSSWLNQVEIWLSIITRQTIRRGTFTLMCQRIATINDYIVHWHQEAKSFTWTATPGEIIAKVAVAHRNFKKLIILR